MKVRQFSLSKIELLEAVKEYVESDDRNNPLELEDGDLEIDEDLDDEDAFVFNIE